MFLRRARFINDWSRLVFGMQWKNKITNEYVQFKVGCPQLIYFQATFFDHALHLDSYVDDKNIKKKCLFVVNVLFTPITSGDNSFN